VDDWKVRIQAQIQGDLIKNPTGQALADLIHKEQEILAKEVKWLQDKAWKARRRVGERKEHRNKTQNTLQQRISLLKAALTQTAPLQPKDKIEGATRTAMQGLGFLHLRATFQKLVRQHDRWKALLTEEISKAEKLMDKENLKQNRRDDRKDIGRKNEIFKKGIKGIKKITGKYNTSKPLTEVKISCPCGLKWTWHEDVSSLIDQQEREERTTVWIKDCATNLRTHSLKLSQQGMEIRVEALADMILLIRATQNSPQDLGTRSLIYDTGPWKGENLLAGIEIFFQKNAYHPFATCGYSECGKTGPIPMSRTTDNATSEEPLPTRSIGHFCEGETCFRTDPTHFRSTRHLTRDTTFLDKAGIFDFRTVASGETIREPVNTFREFSQFIHRMPSHKAPGFLAVPTDLFKQAPAPFQRRIHLLVNEILVGEYDCDQDLLMAKVILIHKDKDIAILDHYRPIALLNTIYQLIMIIITSRLRQLSENYAVLEGSQYGFRAHRGVQMVVQREHWVQQQAMKENGTLIQINLDFKNAFNSAGHSCLWVILRGLGVPDEDFLEDLYSNSWMKIQVGSGCSAPIQLDAETVQGSILSPLLFDLFLNALLRLLDATGITHGIKRTPQ